MRLKKHMHVFINVLCRIVERRDSKRFARGELVQIFNKELQDSRKNLSNIQLSKVVNNQKQYDCEKRGKYYEFRPKH